MNDTAKKTGEEISYEARCQNIVNRCNNTNRYTYDQKGEESLGEEAASEAGESLEARLRKKLARAENHHEYRKGIAKEDIKRYQFARDYVATIREEIKAVERHKFFRDIVTRFRNKLKINAEENAGLRSLRSTQGTSSRSPGKDRQSWARHRPDPAADERETPREV